MQVDVHSVLCHRPMQWNAHLPIKPSIKIPRRSFLNRLCYEWTKTNQCLHMQSGQAALVIRGVIPPSLLLKRIFPRRVTTIPRIASTPIERSPSIASWPVMRRWIVWGNNLIHVDVAYLDIAFWRSLYLFNYFGSQGNKKADSVEQKSYL